jgi:HK97 family phage prohead protease
METAAANDAYVEGWISPEVIDRSGEFVPVEEWDLSEHAKNPVAFCNHDRSGPIVGKWQYPDGRYSIEKRPGGLWGRCYFNLNSPEGVREWQDYKNGFKKGFSPGFNARRPVAGMVRGKPASVLKQATLFEVSLVGVPDNPDALATFAKSFQPESGNANQQPPDGFVTRFGAPTVANDSTATTPETGFKPYLKSLAEAVSLFSTVKETLLETHPDDVERNKAYGLLSPIYHGFMTFVKEAKPLSPDADWQSFEKQLAETFEGFGGGQATVEQPAITAADIDAILNNRFEAVVTPLTQKIAEQDQAITDLTETVAVLVS